MSRVSAVLRRDIVFLAVSSLRRRALRSVLTIGAIAVGIAVLMVLVTLGLGLERLSIGAVSRSVTLLSLTVTSGSERLQPLNEVAMATIKSLPDVQETLPAVTLKGQALIGTTVASVTTIGSSPVRLDKEGSTELLSGRYYDENEKDAAVVTTGFLKMVGYAPDTSESLSFAIQPDTDEYGAVTSMGPLRPVGIIDADKVAVYVPIASVREAFAKGALPAYDSVLVTVDDLSKVDTLGNALIARGFRVSKIADTLDEVRSVFFWVRFIMASLGFIAVVVASIGMFNTLTISLIERTREIGIMKALGVRRKDVRAMFFTESVIIGVCGGLAGVGIGYLLQTLTYGVLSLLAWVAKGTVPELFYNHPLVLAAFVGFAVMVATLTGIYPARRASRIPAIEAIRYE